MTPTIACYCSLCGKPYRAARVNATANYCSTGCRSKAYRERKKFSDLKKAGTFDMDLYVMVTSFKKRYGQDVENNLMRIYEDSGANALRLAVQTIELCLQFEVDLLKSIKESA